MTAAKLIEDRVFYGARLARNLAWNPRDFPPSNLRAGPARVADDARAWAHLWEVGDS